MAFLDSYYTPSPLADKLAQYIEVGNIHNAVDFCVGDGKLLKAVAKRFSNVKLYGTDISKEAIEQLRNERSDIKLGYCDFKDDNSISKVSFLKNKLFDLIVMNPPFTCKGSIVEKICFDNNKFKVSTAMYFLLRALRFLSENGGLYAILPISCVYSEKDKKAWEYLQKNYNATLLEEPSPVCFSKDCAPNIVIVYVGRYEVIGNVKSKSVDFSTMPVKNIIRGCVRMQNLEFCRTKDSVLLIHTTNMQNGTLVGLKRIKQSILNTICGPGVVVPRVCNPNRKKVALLDISKEYALSDCVIVIQTETKEDAIKVRNHILSNWDVFVNINKGTGAQYTTLARMNALFGKTNNSNN